MWTRDSPHWERTFWPSVQAAKLGSLFLRIMEREAAAAPLDTG